MSEPKYLKKETDLLKERNINVRVYDGAADMELFDDLDVAGLYRILLLQAFDDLTPSEALPNRGRRVLPVESENKIE